MKKSIISWTSIFFTVMFFLSAGCERIPDDIRTAFPKSITVSVKNPLNSPRQDAVALLNVEQLKESAPDFNTKAFLILADAKELPGQFLDTSTYGNNQIILTENFDPMESKKLVLCYNPTGEAARNYPKRTQAELSIKVGGKFVDNKYVGGTFQNVDSLHVPPEHTDHSEFIRYEGPGWESDRVGYRFYLDWRNAIDIYGKKKPIPVLQDVGLDGFESYHNMQDWGMDILKVGESLGIGSIGMWHQNKVERVAVTDSVFCRMYANGPVFSEIQTTYYGWKVGSDVCDMRSILSITAGSRMTMHSLAIAGEPDSLCTGLVKSENTKLLKSVGKTWSYLALWGKQSLANDNLGMAILYRNEDFLLVTEDVNSHVVVLKPHDNRLTYGFLAAWEKEADGIGSELEFTEYLDKVLMELDTPIIVNY